MTTDAPRRDLAPSSAAGGFLRDDSMRWERLFINEIKTLKAGSKDQLESLTELASNDASKRYKSIVNIVSKYAQVMKPKYRPSLMYVISSLIMHENPKVSSLYRQRFAIEISVLVERICECRLEQLATVRRNIERWREKGCLESSVLDECEYHVQKFEEAGKEADEEERRKVEDGLLGMERIETPPPPEEEEEEEKKEKEEKPMTNTTTTTVNRWPKLIPAKINNAQHQKQRNNKNRKRKRNGDANINNNREKFTNDNFRQRQQNKPPMNQQQIQQSQHGQGKPSKTQKRRMNRQKFANKKKQDNNGNNKDQKQQQQEKGGKDD